MPHGLVLLMATACGLVAANLYYAQPLVGPISQDLGLSAATAGIIVTVAQLGYVIGLVFIVPLGDLLENRRLMVVVLVLCAVALAVTASARNATVFLLAMTAIGACSVVVQMLLPFAAHLASEESRGRVVGLVTSGLMMGIMLARPIASFVTHASSWPVMFALSSGLTAALALALSLLLPRRQPAPGLGYGKLLASMAQLALTNRVLQRRASYQFFLFGAFSLFWTTVPLRLAGPEFGLSQAGIAWFSLAAVAGAVAAPLGGTLADMGLSRLATGIGMATVALSFPLSRLSLGSPRADLGILTAAAILLDFGVSFALVNSQRAIFSLGAEARSRLNGIFIAAFFVGGALGSAIGAWAYARGGWPAAATIGLGLPVVAGLVFLTEFRKGRPA